MENEKLNFKYCSSKDSKDIVKKNIDDFKKAHFDMWGKQTRPDASWDSMLKSIIDDEAVLCFLEKNHETISYLFIGYHKKFCFGWSQVNLKKYEKDFQVRHFLEWSVIKFLKKRKFRFYELGERFYKYKGFKPSEKYLSISDFKEKFGGSFYPKVFFESKLNDF